MEMKDLILILIHLNAGELEERHVHFSSRSYLLCFLCLGLFLAFLLFSSVLHHIHYFVEFVLNGCHQSEDHHHAQVLFRLWRTHMKHIVDTDPVVTDRSADTRHVIGVVIHHL